MLKFDRSLVARLQHPRHRALVQALTGMARGTGARTVLEGVETTAEFVMARDLGFDLVQGLPVQGPRAASRRAGIRSSRPRCTVPREAKMIPPAAPLAGDMPAARVAKEEASVPAATRPAPRGLVPPPRSP